MEKDNLPFHTVIFPATIMGSDIDINCITHLASTEYLDFEKKKFSKSNNIGIFCNQLEEISAKLDLTEDYWRYYLLKIRPETADSTFSLAGFVEIIKGELAQKIGNFINRAISLSKIHYNEKVHIPFNLLKFKDLHTGLITVTKRIYDKYENFEYREAIKSINKIAEIGNEFINVHEVWNKLRTDPNENIYYLGNILFMSWLLAEYFEPIMPKKSKYIKSHIDINVEKDDLLFDDITSIILLGQGSMNVKTDGFTILFNHVKLKNLQDLLVKKIDDIKVNVVGS